MSSQLLSDLLRIFGENLSADISVALPGKIHSYQRSKRKADVVPLIRRAYADGNTDDMPVITNVPVQVYGSGGAFLDFPAEKDDPVLLLFTDRSLENWLASGAMSDPLDTMHHKLNHCVALIGLRHFGAPPLTTDDDPDAILSFAGAVARLKPDGSFNFTGNTHFDNDVAIGGGLTCEKSIVAQENIQSVNGDVIAGAVSLRHHAHQNSGGSGIGGPPVGG